MVASGTSLAGITAVSNGVVSAKTAAEIHWLVIPAVGAGGTEVADGDGWAGPAAGDGDDQRLAAADGGLA